THQSNNITVVQNWIDSSDIGTEPKTNNRILQELNWLDSETTIFQFFGNIGRVQGVENILHAIQKMKYAHLAKFIFIGDGAYVARLKEQIQSLGSQNILYYGSLDQKEKTTGLNACDVALITLADGMLGLGVPSKSYFSMAADKPLLA
ncbi:glycosyltransferase, partial [Acinetobacter baumannii]